MIAIVDYGVGNLRSVQKALAWVGAEAAVTADPAVLRASDGVILPGVGAFGDAMVGLRRLDLLPAIKEYARSKRPLLGICLGMQLLFSVSEEHGNHVGIGLLPGHVRRMRGDYKIPHVGWNALSPRAEHPLISGLAGGEYAYFVHSYFVDPLDRRAIVATTDYHGEIPAVVANGNVMGVQFHPEKSSSAGLAILRNFASLCDAGVPVS